MKLFVYTIIKNVINSYDWIADKSPKCHPKCRIWYILEEGVQTCTVETYGRKNVVGTADQRLKTPLLIESSIATRQHIYIGTFD